MKIQFFLFFDLLGTTFLLRLLYKAQLCKDLQTIPPLVQFSTSTK